MKLHHHHHQLQPQQQQQQDNDVTRMRSRDLVGWVGNVTGLTSI